MPPRTRPLMPPALSGAPPRRGGMPPAARCPYLTGRHREWRTSADWGSCPNREPVKSPGLSAEGRADERQTPVAGRKARFPTIRTSGTPVARGSGAAAMSVKDCPSGMANRTSSSPGRCGPSWKGNPTACRRSAGTRDSEGFGCDELEPTAQGDQTLILRQSRGVPNGLISCWVTCG